MLALNLLTWWYTTGLSIRIKSLGQRLARTADSFSIGQMLRTLFAPFKQIDAGASGKGPSEMFQAFLSRFVSRFIGFFMRTIMIIIGLIVLLAQFIIGAIIVAVHLALPLALPAGIYLTIIGWIPEVTLW